MTELSENEQKKRVKFYFDVSDGSDGIIGRYQYFEGVQVPPFISDTDTSPNSYY